MNKANFWNYLLREHSSDTKQHPSISDQLFEFALKEAENSPPIAYVRHKVIQRLPVIENLACKTDILRQMTFIYFDTIEEAGERILQLHKWKIQPNLVILDFTEFIDEKVPLSYECLKKFCLLTASLINFSYRFHEKFAKYCKTITFLEVNDASKIVINKLIDIYFHTTNFTSLKCIIDDINKS